MAGPKLPLYFGPLSPRQAAEGISAARATARDLLQDAEVLLERQRWPRALALAALAIEEGGKTGIIRSILLVEDEKELRVLWKAYRTHRKKNAASILPELLSKGARTFKDFLPMFNPQSEHGEILDTVKQIAFYSEASDNCNWSRPEQVINESLARKIVADAWAVAGSGVEGMSSEAELQLWVKHMKPVRNLADDNKVKQAALIACYAEAEAIGVLQGTLTTAALTKFLGV